MTTFSVWAPNASRVDVVVSGERHPMQGDERGWWRTDISAQPGCDYGFSLDGDEPLPDPRSAWQPAGVHGLSRLVEHSSYEWQTDSWELPDLLGSVSYELHIGTFTPEEPSMRLSTGSITWSSSASTSSRSCPSLRFRATPGGVTTGFFLTRYRIPTAAPMA